jgi:hypothetical protein
VWWWWDVRWKLYDLFEGIFFVLCFIWVEVDSLVRWAYVADGDDIQMDRLMEGQRVDYLIVP